jgi:hypothetical protein
MIQYQFRGGCLGKKIYKIMARFCFVIPITTPTMPNTGKQYDTYTTKQKKKERNSDQVGWYSGTVLDLFSQGTLLKPHLEYQLP